MSALIECVHKNRYNWLYFLLFWIAHTMHFLTPQCITACVTEALCNFYGRWICAPPLSSTRRAQIKFLIAVTSIEWKKKCRFKERILWRGQESHSQRTSRYLDWTLPNWFYNIESTSKLFECTLIFLLWTLDSIVMIQNSNTDRKTETSSDNVIFTAVCSKVGRTVFVRMLSSSIPT